MCNKKTLSEKELVRDCIKKFQLKQDKVAFNLLLEKYYLNSCKYAVNFLSRNTYSNLISWSPEEVRSYVFKVFLKAVQKYRLKGPKVSSFKNYLYQLIRYETFSELKSNFNWQCIKKVDQKWYIAEERIKVKDPSDFCNDLYRREQLQEIVKFLKSKSNTIYAAIWKLKIKDFDNNEICQKLNITKAELKGRLQYIKRLIQERSS